MITCFLIIVISGAIAYTNSIIKAVICMTLLSMMMCISYLFLDAPDLALTEASLSACASIAILLSAIKHLKTSQLCIPLTDKVLVHETSGFVCSKYTQKKNILIAVFICALLCGTLLYVSSDLPQYGSVQAPIHNNSSKFYITHTKEQVGIKSFVAAILASYRGYDTLGETLVVLIAGFGVLLVTKNAKHIAN